MPECCQISVKKAVGRWEFPGKVDTQSEPYWLELERRGFSPLVEWSTAAELA